MPALLPRRARRALPSPAAASAAAALLALAAGATAGDVDRRHVVRVPVDRAAPEVLTPGAGFEWTPVLTGDGRTLAFLAASATAALFDRTVGNRAPGRGAATRAAAQ